MAKNKKVCIFFIVLYTVLAFLIIGLMIFLLIRKDDFFDFRWSKKDTVIYQKSYISSEIVKIKMKVVSSDIEIKDALDDKIKVVILGKDEKEATSQLENGILSITKSNKNKVCFGFCFLEEDKVILYLPKDMATTLEIDSQAGEILANNFSHLNLKIRNTSGDIKVEKAKYLEINSHSGDVFVQNTPTINIKNRSGDIELRHIERANIEVRSGNIDIFDFQIQEHSSIISTSGDILIENITDSYIEAKTISGDIQIARNNRQAFATLNINTHSGDITVE